MKITTYIKKSNIKVSTISKPKMNPWCPEDANGVYKVKVSGKIEVELQPGEEDYGRAILLLGEHIDILHPYLIPNSEFVDFEDVDFNFVKFDGDDE